MRSELRSTILGVAAIVGLAAAPAFSANILVNGNFDSGPGSPWIEDDGGTSSPLIVHRNDSPVYPQSGDFLAWLGGLDGATHTLYQDVTVPAGATGLILSGYRVVTTAEQDLQPYDVLTVELRSTGGAFLEELAQWSNLDHTSAWTPFTRSAGSSHAGQTVRLQLRGTTDGTRLTNWYFDTLVLDALGYTGVGEGPPPGLALEITRGNPVVGGAGIRLDLPERSRVALRVLDVSGRRVASLLDGEREAGAYALEWDARRAGCPAGVYFLRLEALGRVLTRRLVVIE